MQQISIGPTPTLYTYIYVYIRQRDTLVNSDLRFAYVEFSCNCVIFESDTLYGRAGTSLINYGFPTFFAISTCRWICIYLKLYVSRLINHAVFLSFFFFKKTLIKMCKHNKLRNKFVKRFCSSSSVLRYSKIKKRKKKRK